MTVKKITIAVLVMLAILAFFTVRHFSRTEKAAIRRRLSTLQENLSRSRRDGNFSLTLKNQRLLPLFADPCRLIIPQHDIDMTMSPQELASEIFRLQTRTAKINIDFFDTSISLLNQDKASVSTTTRYEIHGETSNTHSDVEEIRIKLIKEEDEWLFTLFEQIEILER